MPINSVQFLREWRELIESSALQLKAIKEEEASLKPRADKWSKKEVLGHLCDSCINNYMRIMNLLISKGDCILQSYAQNEWVNNAFYNNRKWNTIIELWSGLNLSFINLVENAPPEAWPYEGIYKTESQSFEYLVTDYVVHMKHHFTQIFTDSYS